MFFFWGPPPLGGYWEPPNWPPFFKITSAPQKKRPLFRKKFNRKKFGGFFKGMRGGKKKKKVRPTLKNWLIGQPLAFKNFTKLTPQKSPFGGPWGKLEKKGEFLCIFCPPNETRKLITPQWGLKIPLDCCSPPGTK